MATSIQTLISGLDFSKVKQITLRLSAGGDHQVKVKAPKDGEIVCYEGTYELAAKAANGNVVQTVDTSSATDFDVKYIKA